MRLLNHGKREVSTVLRISTDKRGRHRTLRRDDLTVSGISVARRWVGNSDRFLMRMLNTGPIASVSGTHMSLANQLLLPS